MQGYCLKCRAHREIKDPEATKLKNGKDAQVGTCPECGTKIYRMGKGT